MKRGLYFILALAMCLSLCACGGGAGEGTGSDHETSNAITSAADAAGTYRLEDDILWLSYESNEYPMVFADGKLYYDVFQKVE